MYLELIKGNIYIQISRYNTCARLLKPMKFLETFGFLKDVLDLDIFDSELK